MLVNDQVDAHHEGMCERCGVVDRPYEPWPDATTPRPGLWEPPPADYGWPDYGEPPPVTLFGLVKRKVKPPPKDSGFILP